MAEENLVQAVAEEQEQRKFISPVLNQLADKDRPKGASACKFCPNAVWMKSDTLLECYCRVTMQASWNSKEQTDIRLCDGMYLGQSE